MLNRTRAAQQCAVKSVARVVKRVSAKENEGKRREKEKKEKKEDRALQRIMIIVDDKGHSLPWSPREESARVASRARYVMTDAVFIGKVHFEVAFHER